jgi:N-acetylglucosamine-6-phosphate deacetylase
MLIKNARVLTQQGIFEKQDVSFDNTIRQIGALQGVADIDAEGCYLIPGLIDLHTHGAVGHDFSDGNSAGLDELFTYYALGGVTSVCATTMTLPEETLTKAVKALDGYTWDSQKARCIGIHLEGPFLSSEKRGAQAKQNLHLPDADMVERINRASGDRVKLIGIAPELPGAETFISKVSKKYTVSLAHTAANYMQAMSGYDSGARYTTHLFNGMNGLYHREPAVIGAAFDSGAWVEMICDGIHIHPSVVRIAFKLFGDRLILISDSLRSAGMPDGCYELGGQAFTVRDGSAMLADGTIAGSSIHLLQAVQNTIAWGISPEKAIMAATAAPAKAIGIDSQTGSLAVGHWADMLLLDAQFNLISTIINGEVIHA